MASQFLRAPTPTPFHIWGIMPRQTLITGLPHRPGELGRAAARLGEKQINIDYSYCGLEPGSALALVVFGVDNLTTAASLLDELAVANA